MIRDEIRIVWMPTFGCNLACAYCIARALPQAKHGTSTVIRPEAGRTHVYVCPRHPEVQTKTAAECPECAVCPEEWIRFFETCPLPIHSVAMTGGEPSCYAGLGDVLAAGDWPICADTNLRIPPSHWLKPQLGARVQSVNCGLQFQVEHPEAGIYWEHLSWVKKTFSDAQVVCSQVVLWREDWQEQSRLAAEKCAALGVEHRPISFDDSFLFKDYLPIRPGKRTCQGGSRFVVLLPDTSAYRCLGHTYFADRLGEEGCLGSLRANGWDILRDGASPCATLLCTTCDQCNKTDLYFD